MFKKTIKSQKYYQSNKRTLMIFRIIFEPYWTLWERLSSSLNIQKFIRYSIFLIQMLDESRLDQRFYFDWALPPRKTAISFYINDLLSYHTLIDYFFSIRSKDISFLKYFFQQKLVKFDCYYYLCCLFWMILLNLFRPDDFTADELIDFWLK